MRVTAATRCSYLQTRYGSAAVTVSVKAKILHVARLRRGSFQQHAAHGTWENSTPRHCGSVSRSRRTGPQALGTSREKEDPTEPSARGDPQGQPHGSQQPRSPTGPRVRKVPPASPPCPEGERGAGCLRLGPPCHVLRGNASRAGGRRSHAQPGLFLPVPGPCGSAATVTRKGARGTAGSAAQGRTSFRGRPPGCPRRWPGTDQATRPPPARNPAPAAAGRD